jgi:hypothetical protein
MKRERQRERGRLKEGALYETFVNGAGVHNLEMFCRTEPLVNGFYCCTVNFNNIKILFTNECRTISKIHY